MSPYTAMITDRETAEVARSPESAATYGLGHGLVVQVDTSRAPNWLHDVIRQLVAFTLPLVDESAYSPRPLAGTTFLRAVDVLAGFADEDMLAPSVVPVDDGGVQIEWHRGGLDVEILVPPAGEPELFVAEPGSLEGWEGSYVSGSMLFPDLRRRLAEATALVA